MRLEAQQPILTAREMEKIRHIELVHRRRLPLARARHLLSGGVGRNGMEAALASLCAHAEDAIHLGYNILIVSDRSVGAT